MNDLAQTSPAPIVSARGLRKQFGKTEILHGLDFDIPAGRIYGLVGHNGAGKTTTLNALLGLTSYEGTVRVLGEDPFARRAALMQNVAFISDVASLPRFLRVRELFALLTNIHPNFSQEKARSFLEGTDVRMEARIKNLSKGMIAQLHLAVVMAIDAKLLVLDEPTLGLDITYRKRFYRRLLEDYMTEERTLLITTHQVDEIEFMLSDIMFIRDGDLAADGASSEAAPVVNPPTATAPIPTVAAGGGGGGGGAAGAGACGVADTSADRGPSPPPFTAVTW
jgi:ABC-2 type transport system ATP-binding protein